MEPPELVEQLPLPLPSEYNHDAPEDRGYMGVETARTLASAHHAPASALCPTTTILAFSVMYILIDGFPKKVT